MSWDWDKLKQNQNVKQKSLADLYIELWLTFWVVVLRPTIKYIGILTGFVALGFAFGLGFWLAKIVIM